MIIDYYRQIEEFKAAQDELDDLRPSIGNEITDVLLDKVVPTAVGVIAASTLLVPGIAAANTAPSHHNTGQSHHEHGQLKDKLPNLNNTFDVIAGDVTHANGNTINGGVSGNQTEHVSITPATATVETGQTLSLIAESHGISLPELEGLNPQIKNFNEIFAGQEVNISANISSGSIEPTKANNYVVVKNGDTLSAIAAKDGDSLAQIEGDNPQISDVNTIHIGQHIYTSPNSAVGNVSLVKPIHSITVTQGNTFSNIAAQTGISEATLQRDNPQIINPNVINPGEVISTIAPIAPTPVSSITPVSESLTKLDIGKSTKSNNELTTPDSSLFLTPIGLRITKPFVGATNVNAPVEKPVVAPLQASQPELAINSETAKQPPTVENYIIGVLTQISKSTSTPQDIMVTQEKVNALMAFGWLEEGGIGNTGQYNLFNNGDNNPALLATAHSESGLEADISFEAGIQATVETMFGSNQNRFISTLTKPGISAKELIHEWTYYQNYDGNKIWAAADSNSTIDGITYTQAGYEGSLLSRLDQITASPQSYIAHASVLMGMGSGSYVNNPQYAPILSLKFTGIGPTHSTEPATNTTLPVHHFVDIPKRPTGRSTEPSGIKR
jgi:LysM repeat protein